MKQEIPDVAALRELLRRARSAVLAPASGGCVRYLLSGEVPFAAAPDGRLCIIHRASPEAEALTAASTMTLRFLASQSPDGIEGGHLVLTGELRSDERPSPPGLRTTLAPDGHPYAFHVRHAHFEIASGGRQPLALADLLPFP